VEKLFEVSAASSEPDAGTMFSRSRFNVLERLIVAFSIAMLVPLGVSSCRDSARRAITRLCDYFAAEQHCGWSPVPPCRAETRDGFLSCGASWTSPPFATLPC